MNMLEATHTMSHSTLSQFVNVKRYNDLLGICIAPPAAEQSARPFHIVFMIDSSGSMSGNRMDTVKHTLRLFTNEMGEWDKMSLITFSSAAQIHLTGESDVEQIRQVVDHLEAMGGTNLETGLYQLLELDLSTVDAVFLLTDGEVNQGIRTIQGLESLVRSVVFTRHAIPVYTLGYGAEHNAQLLQAVAMATRSSYTFAESNEMIPAVVGEILGAMREEVAKGVSLEWEGGARCLEAGALPTDRQFCVGSIIANKSQWVILQGGVSALHLKVAGNEPVALPIPLCDEVGDEEVLEQWFRARAATVFSGICEEGVNGMAMHAKLNQLEGEMLASPVSNKPLVLRILAQIAENRAALDARTRSGRISQDMARRLTSRTTAFATQRGGAIPEFMSPVQREVSNGLVHSFRMATQTVQDTPRDTLPEDWSADSQYPL